MSAAPEPSSLFHVVGVTVAASQIFEVIFILVARLALKQADVDVLEDIEPLSQDKSFKQPVKGLLKELGQAQSIDPALEARISTLIENRHRVIHRSFFQFGWPGPMDSPKEADFRQLCALVVSESNAMSIVFVDLVLTWMKRFPATSPTALAHEGKFNELAARIRSQSKVFYAA